MIRIEPTEGQKMQAKLYIESWMNGWKHIPDYFKADYYSRLFGLTGQIVVSDFLGIPTPENKGPDGGTDILWKGKRWDVKTEIRGCFFNKNTFMHNLHAGQISNKVDGYIFLNYNRSEGVFELCGFIEKINLVENAKLFPGGSKRKRDDGTEMIIKAGGMYELKQEYLMELK